MIEKGTKVRVIKKIPDMAVYWAPEMDACVGRVGVVDYVGRGSYHVHFKCIHKIWAFTEEALEVVEDLEEPEEEPKKTFRDISNSLHGFLVRNKLHGIREALQYRSDGKDLFDFSEQDPSRISYLKGDRIPRNSDGGIDLVEAFFKQYRIKKAFHTKIGRLVSDEVSQQEIQRATALLNQMKLSNYKVEVTTDICHYYLDDNYSRLFGEGDLHNSCMKYEHCQSFVESYERFGPDVVKLLVVKDKEGRLLARALYWQSVTAYVEAERKTIQYMDRVFAVNADFEQMLYSYADKNNIYKYDDVCFSMEIPVDIHRHWELPYFDTFSYYDMDNKVLTNRSGCEFAELQSTEGYCLDDLCAEYCSECSSRCEEPLYSHYGETLCEQCGVIDAYGAVQSRDECVIIEGEYYNKDSGDIVFSDHYGEFYHIDDVVYCDDVESYMPVHDTVHCENEDLQVTTPNAVEVNDEWYYKEGDLVMEIKMPNGTWEYRLKDDLVEVEGDYYPEDSSQIFFDEELNEWRLRQYSFIK